jgi:regulator of sigma E protease
VPGALYDLDPPVAIEHPLLRAAVGALRRTVEIVRDLGRATVALATGRISHQTVGGPILVLHIAGVAAERGWSYFLGTLALISINLGLVNLLPLPALDGGHLLFFGLEAARGRPVSSRARARANVVGFVIIGALILLALKNDLVRYLLP